MLPAGLEQSRLDIVQTLARHHDVEIADAPADARLEIGGVEGGALHQNHRHGKRRERPAGHLGLPQRLRPRLGGVEPGRLESLADARWHRPVRHSKGEAADQLLGASGADQARPVAIADRGRVAQRPDEELRVPHAASSWRKSSTSETAVSVSG
jgi:hypothetical protein